MLRSSCRPLRELDIGELGDAVDREEHVELALGVLEFADVDMD